jgi:hypothetical protein
MYNMLPGNSFPQICVVSVNKSVEYDSLKVVNSAHFPVTEGVWILVTPIIY